MKQNTNEIDDKPITYKEVLERLKDVKLEEYTKQDVLERYVVYGSEVELNSPAIQRLLIKYDFIDSFIDTVEIIEDKEVIKDLLANEVVQNNNIIIDGEIVKIDKHSFITCNGTDIYCSVITLKDRHTSKLYEVKHQLLLDEKSLVNYKKKMQPYAKNVAAIVRQKDNYSLLRCYLKKYDDIDYTNHPPNKS